MFVNSLPGIQSIKLWGMYQSVQLAFHHQSSSCKHMSLCMNMLNKEYILLSKATRIPVQSKPRNWILQFASPGQQSAKQSELISHSITFYNTNVLLIIKWKYTGIFLLIHKWISCIDIYKFLFSASICTYSPPKSCIPSRAKMRMKRKRRNNRLTMDLILLSSETTRLRSEDQYL